jgi:hypothetical protein
LDCDGPQQLHGRGAHASTTTTATARTTAASGCDHDNSEHTSSAGHYLGRCSRCDLHGDDEDGSPFVGTIGFGAPNFDAGGIFALTGSPTSGNVIVNPKGPGVGPNLSTITDLITLVATQP